MTTFDHISYKCTNLNITRRRSPVIYINLLKVLSLFVGLIVCFRFILFFSGVSYGQPLDPSLPGYEDIKPPDRPVIKIIAPESESTVLGPQVTLEYIVSGLSLVATEEAKSNIKGEGHLKITFARYGFPVPVAHELAGKSPIVFDAIPEGSYRITVEVVKNSGASYSPKIQDTTKFKVVHPVATIRSLSSTPTATFTPAQTQLYKSIKLSNQELLVIIGTLFLVAPLVYLVLSKINSKL